MDWQIVDPDLGLNYNAEFSASDLHFDMQKTYAYIAAIQIVMLNDIVFYLKILYSFDKM